MLARDSAADLFHYHSCASALQLTVAELPATVDLSLDARSGSGLEAGSGSGSARKSHDGGGDDGVELHCGNLFDLKLKL